MMMMFFFHNLLVIVSAAKLSQKCCNLVAIITRTNGFRNRTSPFPSHSARMSVKIDMSGNMKESKTRMSARQQMKVCMPEVHQVATIACECLRFDGMA